MKLFLVLFLILYGLAVIPQIHAQNSSENRPAFRGLNASGLSLSKTDIHKSISCFTESDSDTYFQSGSNSIISAEQIIKLPVESIDDLIRMQTGVVAGHFRGGRSNEVSFLIDGIPVDEALFRERPAIDTEPETIQQLEIITGAFSAEYGRALSGIINVKTIEGTNRICGNFSSLFANYYTANDQVFIGLKDGEFDRNQDYKFRLSGPILKDKINFFTNFRYQKNRNQLNGIRRFNVDDYSDFSTSNPEYWYSEHNGDSSFVPLNGNKSLSFLGKLTARLLPGLKGAVLYAQNDDDWQEYHHLFKYNPDGMASNHRNSKLITFQLNHRLTNSMFYEISLSHLDTYTGFYVYEDSLDNRYVHDAYINIGGGFYTGGQQKEHDVAQLKDLNAKIDFSWQVHKNHRLKTGLHYTHHNLDVQFKTIMNAYRNTMYEYYTVYDSSANKLSFPYYKPEIMPNISIYSDFYDRKPIEFAWYLQNQINFGNLSILPGLRYEYFSSEAAYPTQPGNPANSLVFDDPEKMSTYPQAESKSTISPRLGISYRLKNNTGFRFACGTFYQMPPLYAFYQESAFQVSAYSYNTIMGNARLEPQKSIQYEVGVRHRIMPEMVGDVTLFYRKFENLLGNEIFNTYNQIRYGLFQNEASGFVKGMELKYHYNFRNVFLNVNYTLQDARGTADDPLTNFERAAQFLDPVINEIPLNWDQRHTLNLTCGYVEHNFGIVLIGYYDSGTRYSFQYPPENPLVLLKQEPNDAVKPDQYQFDLKGYYDFLLYKGINLRFSLAVYNLFDRKNEVLVYPLTGQAYVDYVGPANLASHHSDYNDYYDQIQNPAMYSAPRLVKAGLEVFF